MDLKKQAEHLSRTEAQRTEQAIDEAMRHARLQFTHLESQEDPYAMHKAVESLPVEVLVEILRAKTHATMTSRPKQSI